MTIFLRVHGRALELDSSFTDSALLGRIHACAWLLLECGCVCNVGHVHAVLHRVHAKQHDALVACTTATRTHRDQALWRDHDSYFLELSLSRACTHAR